MMAKLHACDTWQGLRVWGCGAWLFGAADPKPIVSRVSGSGVESPAVDGESPVHESTWSWVDFCSRVAAGT